MKHEKIYISNFGGRRNGEWNEKMDGSQKGCSHIIGPCESRVRTRKRKKKSCFVKVGFALLQSKVIIYGLLVLLRLLCAS